MTDNQILLSFLPSPFVALHCVALQSIERLANGVKLASLFILQQSVCVWPEAANLPFNVAVRKQQQIIKQTTKKHH